LTGLLLALCALPLIARAVDAPSVVRLVPAKQGHQLTRNGEPYFIKGAGGDQRLEDLAAAGGNSIRTWGADDLEPLLDRAHALGLTVTVGLWLGHRAHGFDYQNGDVVTRQLEQAQRHILKYKDHPALLMWSLGNEMEGIGGDGNNPAIWYAVNHIARVAKQLDPNHPTMTVIAEVGGKRVENIHRFCPDIDVVGINSYGGIGSVVTRYREAGGTKPYVITEFGPLGQWEVDKTRWGAPLEMTSTAKAEWYLNAYRSAVEAHPDLCLGSYVFAWGHKQEATATWYGLFLKDGARLGGVESMIAAWGGPAPSNRCPVLQEIKVDRTEDLDPGSNIQARADASDPDGDELTVKWSLRLEAQSYAAGANGLPDQPEFPEAVVRASGHTAELQMPPGGGGYRLFAYVYDGKGNAAVGNVPLFVKGAFIPPPARHADMPFIVYGDEQAQPPYVPSGYMGNYGAIKMDPASKEHPFSGATCLRVDYTAPDQWGGVVWQSPANDWGDQPGGYALGDANVLTFLARGAAGNEIVSFGVGILGPDKPYPDSDKASLADVHLTTEWQEYTMPLSGKDLSCIKSGFFWTLGGQGAPLTFFLDDIRFVFDPDAPPPSLPPVEGFAEVAPPFEPPRPVLPLRVYPDESAEPPYVPSGFMGNPAAIAMDPRWPDDTPGGSTCLKVTYNAPGGWGGVAWQSPANDWGDQPGGFNLSDANTLTFRARGDTGSEVVSFGVGLIGADKPFADSARAKIEDIHLTREWQAFTIPLSGKDLSCIKSGFAWSLVGQKKPVVFYLDDIQYVLDENAPPAAATGRRSSP
ncbi:MAG: hypothetical protein JXB04_05140, partial [Kiritimatiellae bacterium]|nr:hypothetical protein [Kiritimatiellia bacterium]